MVRTTRSRSAGATFHRRSRVFVNDRLSESEFLSSSAIKVWYENRLLPAPGGYDVTVTTGSPGGGVSAPGVVTAILDPSIREFTEIGLHGRDLIRSGDTGDLFISTTATDPSYPNHVVRFDLATRDVVGAIPVGAGPGPMALTPGGEFLYVAMQDTSLVQRIDLRGGFGRQVISY